MDVTHLDNVFSLEEDEFFLFNSDNDPSDYATSEEVLEKFKNKNNPMVEFLWLFANDVQRLPMTTIFQSRRFCSITSWRLEYKKNSNTEMRPDDILSNVSNFKLKPTFLPSNTLEEYKKKREGA